MAKKFSLTPPQKKTQEQEESEFIAAASNHPTEREDNQNKPWEADNVRMDVVKMVSLRMPEPYILRLQYLSEKTNISQQELLRRIVLPWLEQEADKY